VIVRLGIRLRVLLVAVVPVTLIAIALASYFTHTRLVDVEEALRDRGFTVARQLAPSSEYGIFAGNVRVLQQIADSAVREAGVTGVTIIDAAGTVLARSGLSTGTDALQPPLRATATVLPDTPDAMHFYAPIVRLRSGPDDPFRLGFGGDPQGDSTDVVGGVLVQVSLAPLEVRKRELVLTSAFFTLLGLALAVLLALRIARGVTRPVLDLAEVAARIARGDLDARAAATGAGALGVLEKGINDMAASLAASRRDLEKRVAEATAELQQQKEAAERANRTKTQFLAAASHDLRQPLQAVGLFVASLRLRARDPEMISIVARIERALATLETVLEALLDVSRLDAGVVSPRVERFPAARVLDTVREQFADLAARHSLRFDVHDTRAWCESDPHMLGRIVGNLVSNALRYTRRGGVVVGTRRAGAHLRIEVWDTGPGIPVDKREEIFHEFVQLGNAERSRDKGLGLGLAIVQRLARLLDHPVALRSVPGRGSVFWVSVPRAPVQTEVRPPAPVLGGAGALAGRFILVIDDDREVREALESLLDLQGAHPLTAAGETAAREVLADLGRAPDVIVSDYRLSEGAVGIEVVTRLRRALDAETPAVILTGDIAPAVLKAVAEAGLPILSKPVRPEQLIATLERLIEGPESGPRRGQADG
jgi:signal transduction histidine kinase/CheY-like chemotaxis protein